MPSAHNQSEHVMDVSSSTSPAPMEGHGVYNRNSRVQAAGLSPAVPLLQQAAGAVPLSAGSEPIVIVDYGSLEGKNSLAPMTAAIRALRDGVGAERAISVVHTDLPGNDFAALFQALTNDPASYLRNDSATFASAVGRSFYEQILPSDSVTLGWSSWALQWLSRVPEIIPDHVQVAYSRDASVRAAYARQSAEDWGNFLISRGRELRQGGKLVLLMMAVNDQGDFGYRAVLAAMYAALGGLVDEGIISPTEMRRMAIPTLGRSRADLVAPFTDDGRFADLTIEHVDVFEGDDHIWQQYQQDGDAKKFGARWAAFSRASVFQTLAMGLDCANTDPRRIAFIEKLEAGMAARLEVSPEPTVIPLVSVVLVKPNPASSPIA
jgi:SAM dependent carboxyl methyltransferase